MTKPVASPGVKPADQHQDSKEEGDEAEYARDVDVFHLALQFTPCGRSNGPKRRRLRGASYASSARTQSQNGTLPKLFFEQPQSSVMVETFKVSGTTMQNAIFPPSEGDLHCGIALEVSAVRTNGLQENVVVTDISRDGCQLQTSAHFDAGEVVTLHHDVLGKLTAEVRWASTGRVGLQFLRSL